MSKHIYVYLFIINGHKNGIVLHIKIIKSGNGYSEQNISRLKLVA